MVACVNMDSIDVSSNLYNEPGLLETENNVMKQHNVGRAFSNIQLVKYYEKLQFFAKHL